MLGPCALKNTRWLLYVVFLALGLAVIRPPGPLIESDAEVIWRSPDWERAAPLVKVADLSREGRYNQYAMWDQDRGEWRWIRLPGTRYGTSPTPPKAVRLEAESHMGRPWELRDFSRLLDPATGRLDFSWREAWSNRKLRLVLRASDGHVLVGAEGWNGLQWSVWSPPLWKAYAEHRGMESERERSRSLVKRLQSIWRGKSCNLQAD